MDIKASDVMKLRKMTQAGMMDCKKALVEANGDYERAKELLREKGKLIAAKRSDRETSEGAVLARTNADNTKAVLVCLGCETDFVSGTEGFQKLAKEIADAAIANLPADVDALKACKVGNLTVEEAVTDQTGKSGEKHVLACYEKIEAPYVGYYIHNNKKVATIVGFSKKIADEAVKEIAMQITAMVPVSIRKEDCPQSVIDKELQIYREEVAQEGKPAAIAERIVEGKLAKFFKERTLEEQVLALGDGKQTVAQYLKSVDPEVKVVAFKRYSLSD
ncbi:MAG: translation elongation factor Ts [Bacteroidales bacterium]|jgi:elongation factor Ts|nr:translation elongation factor Ts [Bacteroidales bacterium]